MKKLLPFLLLLPVLAFAGQKTLHITWNQVISDDFAGWKLYQDGVEVLDIPYTGQTSYETDMVLNSPDGQTITYSFYLTSYDTSGNESGPSNVVDKTIDFEAPGIPFELNITIEAQ